ncbi:MAG: hypothetical protein ACLPXB_04135 [Thiobacillaceae bacterium]
MKPSAWRLNKAAHPQRLSAASYSAHAVKSTCWQDRCRSILDLKNYLYRDGARIIKFFLHLSEEEQRRRFLDRINAPELNWKLSLADLNERKFWAQYMQAYEACLTATSAKHPPRDVVPADDKENARLIVSSVILMLLMRSRCTTLKPTWRAERSSWRSANS